VGVLTSSPERLDPLFFGNGPKPQNVVWLVSASTVSEMNQRWLALRALGHAGWRVGWHLEPLLGDVAGSLGAGGALASLAWIVSGAPRGEESGREAYDWHRRIRDAAARLGVPFWMKSLGRRTGRRLDGVEHNALPAGWPAVTL
jgi:protein gp37